MTTQRSDATTTATLPAAPSVGDATPSVPGRIGTGSKGTRILGLVTLVGIALAAVFALVTSPQDENMGDVVRILYIHVPIVSMAYVGCVITTVASAVYLWKRSVWWDITAAASAEIAMVLTALTLVIGMIWGRPTWGVWWVWDARLTSTAMLLLLLLGYLAVRRLPAAPGTRSKRAAIVGLLLLPNVFIVNRSVTWWRSLHQGTTILNTLQPKIHDQMAFTLVFSMAVVALLFTWLLVHRWRLAWLEEQVQGHDLDQAIIERRAEAGFSPSPSPSPAPPAPAPPATAGVERA
ncbi:MAG: cytochrome c biogenesis protein CcsA [Acidimicrobiales bacterium]